MKNISLESLLILYVYLYVHSNFVVVEERGVLLRTAGAEPSNLCSIYPAL